MLSEKDALTYKEQLHPAYAGYLHDGEITEKDVLATLFHLMKTGVIAPIFKDNNMTKEMVRLSRTHKNPSYEFEMNIMNIIFSNSEEVTISQLKETIQSEQIQNILLHNVRSISEFPLINKKLRFFLGNSGEAFFSINGKPVTNINTANEFSNSLTKIILPLFTLLGTTFLIIGILTNQKSTLSCMGIMFIGIPFLIYYSFTKSNKSLTYNFENKIIPFSKERYNELYEFLKSKPLNNHNFNNEFLPYSIAFGIDTSWNKDFWIDTEIEVDTTSLTQ